jgi:hypothetical protein
MIASSCESHATIPSCSALLPRFPASQVRLIEEHTTFGFLLMHD